MVLVVVLVLVVALDVMVDPHMTSPFSSLLRDVPVLLRDFPVILRVRLLVVLLVPLLVPLDLLPLDLLVSISSSSTSLNWQGSTSGSIAMGTVGGTAGTRLGVGGRRFTTGI